MRFFKQTFNSGTYKPTAYLIFAVLFLFAFNAAAISAQDKKPLKLKEVISKIKENSAEENGQKLVKEICERGVDFALTAENEKSLRDAGANDLLIKTIHERFEIQKEKESLYELYTCSYSDCGGIEKLKRTVKAGRDYLDKFENSACSQDDPLIPYFKENLPILEQEIKDEENKTYTPEKPDGNENIKRFSDAVINKNWDTVFITGAKIFEYEPKYLDVAIILAKVGYEQTIKQKQKSKYDKKAIYYAELAIKLMEEGEKSRTGNYGTSFGKGANYASYQYKTGKFPDGRANALGWMNYIVGYVKYFQLNRKDEAIPYFERSTQYRSEVADFPETYTIIGDWNFGKFVELNEKSSNSGETGAEKQFAERAVLAYKKAYDLAKADSKVDVLEKLKKLYALSFGKEEN